MKKLVIILVMFAFFCCGAALPEKADEEVFEVAEIKYNAPESKTPELAVTNYFDALYDSYRTMLPMDLSAIIDLDFEMMVNVQSWSDLLAMRRSIISEKDYCFVENHILDQSSTNKLIVYRWDKSYPSDHKFNLSNWKLASTMEFMGYSHDTITKEVYIKDEK